MRIITTFFLVMLVAGSTFAQSAQTRGTNSHNITNATFQNYTASPYVGKVHTLKAGKAEPWTGRSACDTLFMEDFQSQTIPANWQNIDVDGNTPANANPGDWYITADAQTTTANDTNWVAAATSWFSPFATANNWLITDSFTVCDPGLYLIWESAPFEGPVFADGYKVLVSTTDSMMSSFTDTLAVFSESVNGTATQSPGVAHANYNGNNGILTRWQYSLSAYNGQKVFIAFVHDSNDDNIILLDDIMVAKLPSQDMETVSVDYTNEYPFQPINHVGATSFMGRVANQGAMAATNPTLSVDVNSGTFTDNASIASLAAFSDTMLTMTNTFTPTTVGTYNALFSASMTEPDPVDANDTLSLSFFVTDTTLGRDNGSIDGALSIGSGANPGEGIIAQEFTTAVADTLTSIGFFLTAPTPGDSIIPLVMPLVGGVPNDVVPTATLPAFQVIDPNPNYYVVRVPGGVALAAGETFVLGLRESLNTGMTLATSNSKFTETKGWVYLASQGSWANSEDFGFNVAYVLRANLGGEVLLVDREKPTLDNNVFMYPNPTDNLLWLVFAFNQSTDLDVNVYDTMGRSVYNTSKSSVARDRMTIDMSSFSPGVYFVEVSNGSEKTTQKIQVLK